MNTKKISDIERYGKTARGKKELINHLKGKKLTARQAMLAYCYGCAGYFADGKVDCKMPICPLHSYMAYKESRSKRKNGMARH